MGMWTLPGNGDHGAGHDPSSRVCLRDWAERIVAAGMTVPAVTLLEWGKPLATLWGAGICVGMPVLEPFFAPGTIDRLGRVLGDAGQIEELLRAIEEAARKP